MSAEDVKQVLGMLRGGSVGATLSKAASFIRKAHQMPSMIPRSRFDQSKSGTAPDYNALENWLSHPRRLAGKHLIEDANHLAAAGCSLPALDDRPCDCFWLVDSCCCQDLCEPFIGTNSAGLWNVPFGASADDPTAQQLCAKVREMMEMRTASGASCFNKTCRIYSPLYRQAAVLAYLQLGEAVRLNEGQTTSRRRGTRPDEAVQAMDLAYDDVRRAFLHFISDPERVDRPFIIAGHSQGSMHLSRILQEEIEHHPDRLRRFVHGYLTGWAVPLDLFSRTLHVVRPSQSPSDTCSISSWRTAGAHHPEQTALRASNYITGRGWRSLRGVMLLCNNPVTWSSEHDGPTSEPREHLGALWPLASNMDPRKLEAGLLTSGVSLRFGFASCETKDILGLKITELTPIDCGPVVAKVGKTGLLRVSGVSKDSLFGMAERDWLLYHDLDCALFHKNLQANVAQRLQAWKALQLPSRL